MNENRGRVWERRGGRVKHVSREEEDLSVSRQSHCVTKSVLGLVFKNGQTSNVDLVGT